MAVTNPNIGATTTDILIVGAGIAGTALASFLCLDQLKRSSSSNLRITILERSSSIQGRGQNIDIRGPGKDVLEKLGIDDEVKAATTGEEGARFVDSTGKAWGSFAVDKTGEIETGTGEIEILRGRLAEILFQRCKALSKEVESFGGVGVEFIFGESVDQIQQQEVSTHKEGRVGKVQARFAKSKIRRSFDIVVGADGLQSQTRKLAWNTESAKSEEREETHAIPNAEGMTREENLRHRASSKSGVEDKTCERFVPSGEQTIAKDSWGSSSSPLSLQQDIDPYLRPLNVYNAFFSIPASFMSNSEEPSVTSKRNTKTDGKVNFNDGWRRWYHASGRKSVMLRPSDDKSRLTVLFMALDLEHRDPRLQSVATVQHDRKATVLKQKHLMREYFEEAGWECARLVDGMDASDDFYYDLVAQVKMERWSLGQVCLLGDAAHCASPFSGMGTTLALLGAHNLARALTKHLRSTPASTEGIATSFSEYESNTRPIVAKAQKLPPGMPWLIHPETAWGVWVMHRIIGFVSWTGLDKAIARIAASSKGKSKHDDLAASEVE